MTGSRFLAALRRNKRIGGAADRLAGSGLRKLATRSGWTLAGTAVVTLAVFAETIVLARYLEPKLFGVFLLIVAFPEAVMQVLDLRVKEAANKYLSEALVHERRDRAAALLKLFWGLDAVVGILCFAIVFLTARPVAEAITGDPDDGRLMVLFSFGLLLATLDTASGTVLRVLDRFGLAFAMGSLAILARLGLVVAVVIAGGNLEAIIWARNGAEVISTLAVGGASVMVLRPLLKGLWRTPVGALGETRGEVLRFLLNTNLTGTLKMATTKLDTILLGAFASPAAVALYRFALQFARGPLLLADAMYTAIFPSFARATARGRQSEMRRQVAVSSMLMLAIIVPICVAALFFAGDLLALAGGEQYRSAGTVLVICLIALAPSGVLFWMRPLILTAGHAGFLLRNQALATGIQLAGILILTPSMGAKGAAIGLAGGGICGILLQALFVRRHKLLQGSKASPLPPAATPGGSLA